MRKALFLVLGLLRISKITVESVVITIILYIYKIIYIYIYKIFVKSSNEKYTPNNQWFRITVKNNFQTVLIIRESLAWISMS